MLNLREYRKTASHLADFLPWAALVAPGVVLNKDGSFQRTARFRGPDLESATPAELVATTARLNNALRRLGDGHFDLPIIAQHHALCDATDEPQGGDDEQALKHVSLPTAQRCGATAQRHRSKLQGPAEEYLPI